ncbi:RNA dependent RNA polymerase [Oesophagostomum dentatum]|uniref:RNA-dependent RNA polymerase n=1 Tax=Oesophagostomum dentatum TaxID=61180 RepID=A0A0B1TGM7_OESDE|nr:RNA dependent RNA polymerase [Oesophagostomum dentatum]
MRDAGAYFMEKYSHHEYVEFLGKFHVPPPLTWQPKIQHVRLILGDFTNLENIYKLMARLGQCFTQSKQCDVSFERSEYIIVPDIVGGSNSLNGEYTFSDGVGMISKNFAGQVARDMKLRQCVPSCFQFRFRGMKGVLAVNPMLDEIALWAVENGITSRPNKNMFGNCSWLVKMVFRDSQVKFSTVRKEKETIEIVKYSTPSTVALNKPFICILDQVSQKQSPECHVRVTNRIEELAEEQLRGYARSLLYEETCRNKLKELPQRICINLLPKWAGFDLSTEPFFRSLVKAMANYYIVKQMRKQQFPIPANKGRTMLGVIDDTGQLQYGQVFVQYTENVTLKCPSSEAARKVLTGKVMLTKSPSVVAGDVRVFTAVDIADLHHFCDVVVFPQHGPRPHPDEMAGSDLDGDEYAVIWDEDLILDRSEPAFDYTCEKPENVPIDPNTMNEEMVDFYCDYLIQDSIGTIANSFQFQADYYGINSNVRKVCNSLARKHAQAVDFPKTGCPPSRLRTTWSDGEPPEKPERQPDFHCSYESSKALYRSERLLGHIFRNIRAVDDVFKAAQDVEKEVKVVLDPYLIVDGWEDDMKFAKAELQRYNGLLRGIMENYGIKTEAEAFSGCIVDIRNRISDRDQDDMSFYTTNEIIDQKITNLFRMFRKEFFREFGGWRNCLKSAASPYASSDDVLDYYIAAPPRCMEKKAVAYYRACYELANRSGEQLLSFAWIAYDVLAVVKRNNVSSDEKYCPATCPVFEVLDDRLIDFYLKNEEKIEDFAKEITNNGSYLSRYLENYPGLERVMYLIVSWAERNGLLSGCLQWEHMCLILLLFATGRITGSMNIIALPMLDALDVEDIQKGDLIVPTGDQYARMVVHFFEYLASRAFRKLPHLSFISVGSNSVFMRGQWLPIHEAAVKTYYSMVFNMDFDELIGDISSASNESHECEPFVVELPS